MSRALIPLEVIDVPKPCPADWNAMRGDDRSRFCKHCSLHVYNLSAMSRAEAEQLVADTEGRLCVRLYRRADGTVITQDCGGGWRLAAKRLGRFATAATALMLTAALAPLGLAHWLRASATEDPSRPISGAPRMLMGDVADPPQPQPPVMGKICVPATQRALMGEAAATPLMGAPVPPPPATRPATQPAK